MLEAGGNTAELARRREAAEIAQERLEAAEASAMEAEAAHSEARAGLDQSRRPLAEAEKAVQRFEAEARTLAKLLDVGTKKWPPVIDAIRVARGFEAALGAALGDDLDAPADAAAPVHWGDGVPHADDPTLPEGAEPLAASVQAPAALARRLNQIGVVTRTEGSRLAPLLRPGQRLVSREGDLWRWDGFHAAADAPTARRPPARRAQPAGRCRGRARRRPRRGGKRPQGCRGGGSRAASFRLPRECRPRGAPWRRPRLRTGAQRAVPYRARRRRGGRPARRSRRYPRTDGGGAGDRRRAAGRSRSRAGSAAAGGRRGERARRHPHPRGAGARGAGRGARRRRRADARARAARPAPAGHRRRARFLEARAGGTGERLAAIETRREEAAIERAELEEAPDAFAARRRNLLNETAKAEEVRRAAADRLAAAETAQANADKTARAALDGLASAREEAARTEARLEGSRQRRTDLVSAIAEMLDGPPDLARETAALDPAAPLPDPVAVEADLDRLKRERERLGAVNLRAEEELGEVETQQAGLTGERDDLTEAIKRLRQGITSLNREARERLQASFIIVDGHFRQLFGTLFGGGEAQLVLTDSEDPLEAGLDIIAKPPGKKPQSLSLLSGGEQALTAMALIFAVFLTNPSPICVLDEVDAPLDDANVERFCNLLDEMRRLTETRFVTITHNPITMSRMNRLFGVTMAERGVSKLVSVDLATAERFLEAS